MLSFFLEWKQISAGFFYLLFLYICIAVGDPVIKRGGGGIPLTSLTLPHFCARPNQGPGLPTSYIVVSLCVCACSVSSVKMRGICLSC